jgi:hypothetical protein
VEFAEADSATFIYRTGGDFHAFAKQLNYALEGIGFRREILRLSDAQLQEADHADACLALQRSPALQAVRAHFVGRAIHTSPSAWKKKLMDLFAL